MCSQNVVSSAGLEAEPRRFVTAVGEPWLSYLATGAKTHEGRLCQSGWSKLQTGDKVEAFSARYMRVVMTVTEVLHFPDFDQAFAALGACLLPEGAVTPEEALKVYRKVYSAEEVLEAGGVVAVGVIVSSVEERPRWNGLSLPENGNITTADDLCPILFRMLQSYSDGLPLHLLRQMIGSISGRSLPPTAFEGAKLTRLLKRAPFSTAFFVQSSDGIRYLRMR